MRGNTVTLEVSLKRGKMAKTIPLYQYDYGQKVVFTNVELPNAYEVHFANAMHGDAITMLGDSSGVLIPDSLLTTGLPVYLWVYLHDEYEDGETEYTGVIPVIQRATPTDVQPTPEEQSLIAQLIAALSAGVDDVNEAVQSIGSTISDAMTEAKESGLFDGADGQDGADGADGYSPTIAVTSITGGYRLSITDKNGTTNVNVMNGTDGAAGPAGINGTNGTDGQNGQDGEDGYSPMATVTKDGSVTTISITDKSGTTTATVSDGEDGADGADGQDGQDGVTPSFSIGTVASGTTPGVTITGTTAEPVLNFVFPKGDTGNDFHIKKTFVSIEAMEEYDPDEDQSASKVLENDFVMIDTGSVEDQDTGKLFCYEPETLAVWRLIGDLSGAQGIKGETGTGIDHIALNADYTLTIYLDNNTSYTTTSIRGATGETGATGATGQTGATPNISVGTVTTLPQTDNAYVVLDSSSTAAAPVFNFGIPRGESGLPYVTSSDNGKIMRVVNGVWGASTLNPANGVSF